MCVCVCVLDLYTTPCNLLHYLTLGTGAVTRVCIWCCHDTRLQTNPDTKQEGICILFSIHVRTKLRGRQSSLDEMRQGRKDDYYSDH